MFNRNTRFFRFVAIFTCSVLLETYATAAVQAGVGKVYDAHERYVRSQPKAQTPSRILSSGVMKSFQGKAGTNPYASGQAKWDVVYKGVNLRTGNYSMSATGLTFEGGYGIPVNVTRSYSSNNAEEGPLGIGWNLSVDVRSTAGGIQPAQRQMWMWRISQARTGLLNVLLRRGLRLRCQL